MPSRNWPATLLVIALMAALILGLLRLAGMGSAASYPEMSSLNSGPDGAALLFDALANVPQLSVTRNYLPFAQWHPAATTILLFAVGANSLNLAETKDLAELEKLSQPNNRLVICVSDSSKLIEKPDLKKIPALETRWGAQIVKALDGADSEPKFSFQHDESWKPVSGVDDAWEKRLGESGTVVIALNSERFANRKMADDKTAQAAIPLLLAPHSAVAFEESHLGMEESGSIAGLARRYRLQGLVAGLLLLAVLFIWNRSVSFPPPSQYEKSRETQVTGAGTRGMFAGLLTRHLSPQALIDSCIAEWNRVTPRQRISLEPQKKIDAAAAYSQLQEGLRVKRGRA